MVSETLLSSFLSKNNSLTNQNTCLPMQQGKVDPEQMEKDLAQMHDLLTVKRFQNNGGFLYDGLDRNLLDDTPEQRDQVLQEAFDAGGFRPLFRYNDMLIDEKVDYPEHFTVVRWC